MEIPSGHQVVMPYLMVHDADQFIEFTGKVFHAKPSFRRMREDGKTIMHAEIMIGNATIMFCEATGDWPQAPANLFVYVEDADACFSRALANGAISKMELADQDYGRSGGVTDPFGNTWWITAIKS